MIDEHVVYRPGEALRPFVAWCTGYRQAEQDAGAERAERELDARLTAVVPDQGGRGVQSAEQEVMRAGGLAGIRVPGDDQRLIEGDDHREPG